MTHLIEKTSLRKWICGAIITTTSLLLVALGYIAKSNNEESVIRAKSSTLSAVLDASLELGSEFESVIKGILLSEGEPREQRLNIFLNSAHYTNSSADIILTQIGDSTKGFIKNESKAKSQLSDTEISILNQVKSTELSNKSILAKISGRIYVIRKETFTSASNRDITLVLGRDVNNIITNAEGINSVIFEVINDKYTTNGRDDLISMLATDKGILKARFSNKKWVSTKTLYEIIAIAITYYLSIFIMFYLYRAYAFSTFKLPMKHLLMVLSSNKPPKEIDCPEAFGSISKVVSAINAAISELTKQEFFEKAAIESAQVAVAIADNANKIIYVNPQFYRIFPIKDAIGIELSPLLDMHKIKSGNFNERNLIEIKNTNGASSLYQVSTNSIKNTSYEKTIYEFQNIDKVINLKKKLEDRFKKDELTSLHTRFHFNDLANEIILSSTTEDTHFLALIDINDFKILNDSAGHDIGDLILMELATLLQENTNNDDILGRMSGDEFVILFKNKSLEFVESKLCKLYTAIKNYKILHFDTKIGVSASIGLTNASKTDNPTDIRILLQQADLAVMTAKKSGLMFKLYDENDSDIMFYREAPQWINRIKNSIAYNNFELFAQEITPFSSDNPQHLEVLLRMKDEKGGYYAPFKFFEVAEKFNLMKQIDEWVVINTFQNILRGTFGLCKVSINLSAETIRDINAVEKIIYYAKAYKLDASKVVFEITETMAIDDINTAIININTLRFSGFSIALDDFGSGFSTFKYIQSIPADYIKIDGIFVKNATKCDRDRAIVANIVSIAHELNMHCVAEFVENEETLRLMERLKVDYIQGYHVHKPCPVSEWSAPKKNSLQKIA
jgi:diguanylate cyclase (GGDEF)-like protein